MKASLGGPMPFRARGGGPCRRGRRTHPTQPRFTKRWCRRGWGDIRSYGTLRSGCVAGGDSGAEEGLAMIAYVTDIWGGLDKWVKRLVVVGGALALLSQLAGVVLGLTLDDRYVLAADAKSYVTTVEFKQQI